jgi:hypothetical protein
MKHLLLTLCLTTALHAQQPAAAPHTFTSTDGRKLTAVIVARTDGAVTLRRVEDGQVFELPLDKLSAADQTRVRDSTIPVMERNVLGNDVLAFSLARLGRKVGGGECAHLAVEALKSAGAGGRRSDAPNAGDYVWGELVAYIPANLPKADALKLLTKVQPGDVIQMRNTRFEGKRPGRGTYWTSAAHHTVLVERVDAAAGVLHILHQNWNGARHVVRGEQRIADLKQGWLRIFRPVLPSRSR